MEADYNDVVGVLEELAEERDRLWEECERKKEQKAEMEILKKANQQLVEETEAQKSEYDELHGRYLKQTKDLQVL